MELKITIDIRGIIVYNPTHNRKDNMKIEYKGKTYDIPKPFDQCYFGAEPTKEMTIFNRFSDESFQASAKLPAFAVAIYDWVDRFWYVVCFAFVLYLHIILSVMCGIIYYSNPFVNSYF